MKKITRLFLMTVFLLSMAGFTKAQSTIDFETVGNTWTWTTFEFTPQWSVVANPSATGINTSANVGKFVIGAGDQRWAGVECARGQFGPYVITADNHIIKIMVYKDVISPVGIKLTAVDGWSKGEKKVSNTKINEWEELTFDFIDFIDPGQPGPYDQIVFFPDFPDGDRTAGSTSYIDNISFPGAQPATITLSASALNIGYQEGSTNDFGITTELGWTVVSDQTWLTANPTSGTGNGAVTLTATVNPTAASREANVTVTASDATVKTVKVTQTGSPVTAAPTPTVAPGNVKAIFSDAYTPVAATYQNWYGTTMSEEPTTAAGDIVKKVSSVCCFGYELADKNVSDMTKLHVDIYPTTLTTMEFGIVSNGDKKQSLTLTPNQWNAVDLTLADFAGADLSNVAQIGFWSLNGDFYMDNLLFYSGSYTTSTAAIGIVSENNIKCFPSVVATSMTVSAESEISQVNILSLVGQLTKSESINSNSKTIDLSSLSSGNYLVSIKLANGQLSTKKITKL